ncbi:MAG: hypothetical protein KGO48_00465 [Alphaproteobacteria bacterium]|nr:hypothetical protein [Alphaproteobacteria bacterium]
MHREIAIVLTVLLLAGCINATGMMLTDSTAVVSALGPASSDREVVFESALAEAARLARTYGYQYFIVLKLDERSVTTTKYTAGETIPLTITGHVSRSPVITGTLSRANLPGGTLMVPGTSVTSVKPGLAITVKMYRRGEIDSRQDGVWNIDFLPGAAASGKSAPSPPSTGQDRG